MAENRTQGNGQETHREADRETPLTDERLFSVPLHLFIVSLAFSVRLARENSNISSVSLARLG